MNTDPNKAADALILARGLDGARGHIGMQLTTNAMDRESFHAWHATASAVERIARARTEADSLVGRLGRDGAEWQAMSRSQNAAQNKDVPEGEHWSLVLHQIRRGVP